ncbi:hypothetical protein [Mycobacterium bourgelatii]|uniref:Uncharacterized protein n=1 Tax=Mycobacterium bourgelatii TaxID=1273442 RepID=A0A7I9YKX6_MYCBU|nr:hypothetical protein [Mycobacterium bourgelatii]MCV6975708.1 hypothetical protein [Mycobacterium bourgelatii]GFG89310.1 hypothetical protein MBOU_13520 [Mycobacterium bourgelatii]
MRHIDFEVTGSPPSLDHYRRSWTPSPDVALAGIWLGAVVSDESGQNYWGLRGLDDFVIGMTHVVSPVCGFRSLPKTMESDAPHLFEEYASIDWFEPFEYSEDSDTAQMLYTSGRVARDADGLHWYDASGRWEIHGYTGSDVVVTHVPRQEGDCPVADEVYYRHELLYATGTINGVPVSGYAHQDFAYGPPGLSYTELPIARHLQGMWVSWLHEYDDGRLGGGSFWQGRDDLAFGPGYQVRDGKTTVHHDIVATAGFNDAGKVVSLETVIGGDTYTFAFDTSGSPLHVFGNLIRDPSGQAPARSWCWVEYAGGMLTPEILDLVMQRFRLARAGQRVS